MATQQELRKLTDIERQLVLTEKDIDPRGTASIRSLTALMSRRPKYHEGGTVVADCPTGTPDATAWPT